MATFTYTFAGAHLVDAHTLVAEFGYTAGDVKFESSVRWKSSGRQFRLTPSVDNLVGLLGFIEGLSYWKASFASRIDIAAAEFPPMAVDWCQGLLLDGMAECGYRNGLLGQLRETQITVSGAGSGAVGGEGRHRVGGAGFADLLLFSGGKDSLATSRALANQGRPAALAGYGWKWSDSRETSQLSGFDISIERVLDRQLRELNARGAINGHVPFSAYLGLAAVIGAELVGSGAALAGNTRSDDEPNVVVGDWKINHQWSKSLEFEASFRALLSQIGVDVTYECPLRAFYEIQILNYLIEDGVSIGELKTCNRVGSGWCGRCAKCTWVYLAVAALKDPVFAESELGFKPSFAGEDGEILKSMTGLHGAERPFECTGTSIEVCSVLGHLRGSIDLPGYIREEAVAWDRKFPLRELLGERGPRPSDARYDLDIVVP